MFGISNSKTKDKLALVFYIGSSSVRGALFVMPKSGIPKIIFFASEYIVLAENINIDTLLSSTLKSLKIIAGKILNAGLGAPSEIFCVLSSSWHVSQTRIISLQKNVPFIFTSKLANDLVQKEVALFEEEHMSKYMQAGSPVRMIELKNIKTILNGYETSKPLNQKTKELEMTIFISMSSEEVLSKITDMIKSYFHVEKVKFSSLDLASFTVVRDLFPEQKNFLLVKIGGELTDISMTKKDILKESTSYPLGVNFIVRGLSKGLNCTLAEAQSFFSLYKDGHASAEMTKKMEPIMNELKMEWLKKFQESLSNISNDVSIPAAIFILVDENLADFFSELIRNEQFNQYSLTESKFQITFLGMQVLRSLAVFDRETSRDSFITISSSYINRFMRQ